MTELPTPLFDVEPLRALSHSALGMPRHAEPVVVLGARQSPLDLDPVALDRDAVVVRRRHGGGGAVLLRPADRWIEIWLRADPDERTHDVRSSAYLVGGWWQQALRHCGVDAEVHRGAVRDAGQGAVACFAGLGPGEISVGGRKVVGLSQWRVREGVLISSVLAVECPTGLCEYLSSGDELPRLAEAASVLEIVPDLEIAAVLESFVALCMSSYPTLKVDAAAPFA